MTQVLLGHTQIQALLMDSPQDSYTKAHTKAFQPRLQLTLSLASHLTSVSLGVLICSMDVLVSLRETE